jgi:hypothetical protein
MRAYDDDLIRSANFADNVGDLHAVCDERLEFNRQAKVSELPLNICSACCEAVRLFANAAPADVARNALDVLAKTPADFDLFGG